MVRDETLLQEDTLPNVPSDKAETVIQEQEIEIDFLELARVWLSNKMFVFKCALLLAIVTLILLSILRPTYTAEASFLPPNSMSPGSPLLGQLGSLAGMTSSNPLGSLKDPTQIYVGILKSRTIADNLIRQFDLAKVYKARKLSQAEKALRAHSDFASGKDTIVTIRVSDHDPKRAADLANAYLSELRKQNDRIALTDVGQKRLFFEQQLEKEKNALAEAEVELTRLQEKTGMILPTGQTQLQIQTIAQTRAEIASREVRLMALSQAATEQNPEVIRLRSEIAGLKSQLTNLESSNGQSEAGDVNISTSKAPGLTLDYVRRAREVKYHEALYELLLRQYESAKLDESKSAPLIQVVDAAVVPDSKSGPLRAIFTMIAFVLGAFIASVWVYLRYGFEVLSRNPAAQAKLTVVRRAALSWK